MKHLYRPILLSIIALFLANTAQANHVMGGAIEWDDLGNDRYRVKVIIYRDCNGILGTMRNMTITGSCSGIQAGTQTQSLPVDITPVCATSCTRCDARSCNFPYGVQRVVLTRVVDVSQFKKNGCEELVVKWSTCCRNSSITNSTFYLEAKIDVDTKAPNSSVKWSEEPKNIFCLSEDFKENLGGRRRNRDTTGVPLDSMVYSLAPMQTGSGPVNYKSPYSATKPLDYLGFPKNYSPSQFPNGFHLDSTTGMLRFRPTKLNQSAIVVQAETYRNGKRIATTMRELMVITIKCPTNNPPVLSGVNCAKPQVQDINLNVCIGQKVCFTMCATDKDSDDTVHIDVLDSLPGMTVSKTMKGRLEEIEICWNPSAAQAQDKPYEIRVFAYDDNCPMEGRDMQNIRIKVNKQNALPLKHQIAPVNAACGEFELKGSATDNALNNSWTWYLHDSIRLHHDSIADKQSSFNTHFRQNGRYPVKMVAQRFGCKDSLYDTVVVSKMKPIQYLAPNDTALCHPFAFKDSIRASGGHDSLSFSWLQQQAVTVGDTLSPEIHFTTKAPNSVNDNSPQTIYFSITDKEGCRVEDSFAVTSTFSYQVNLLQNDSFCSDSLFLPLDSQFTGFVSGQWNSSGVRNNHLNSFGPNASKHDLWYQAVADDYCVTDSATIWRFPLPVVSAGASITACTNMQPFALKGSPSGGSWSGNFVQNNLFVTATAAKGQHWLRYSYTDQNECTATDSARITVLDYKPKITLPKDTFVCQNQMPLALSASPSLGNWQGQHLSQQNNQWYFDPTSAGIKTHELIYTGFDSIACQNQDTLLIEVKAPPTVNAGKDILHCFDGPVDTITLNGKPQGGSWRGNLAFGKTTVAYAQRSSIGRHIHTYRFTDQFGCKNEDFMTIDVRSRPNVNAGSADTLCAPDGAVSIPVQPTPLGGSWLNYTVVQDSLQLGPKQRGPILAQYRYSDAGGCDNVDTLQLWVGRELQAQFSLSDTSGRAPLTVKFTNNTQHAGSERWFFGDGNSTFNQNPLHLYADTGIYKITLVVQDSWKLCADTASQVLAVLPNAISSLPNDIAVYPTLVQSNIWVAISNTRTYRGTILSSVGETLWQGNLSGNSSIKLDDLPKGAYVLLLQDPEGQVYRQSFIKGQ